MKNIHVRDNTTGQIVTFPKKIVTHDNLSNILSRMSIFNAVSNRISIEPTGVEEVDIALLIDDKMDNFEVVKKTVAEHIFNNLSTTNFKRDFTKSEIIEKDADAVYRKDTSLEEKKMMSFVVSTPRREINNIDESACIELTKEYKDFYQRNNLAEIYTMEDVENSKVLSSQRKKFLSRLAYNCRLRISASLRVFSPISTFLGFKLEDSVRSSVSFKFTVDSEKLNVGFTVDDVTEALTFKMDGYDPVPARAFTDFSNTYFDLEWVANLSSAQVLAVYLHELCHPFFRHASRMETLSAYRELQDLNILYTRLKRQFEKVSKLFLTVKEVFDKALDEKEVLELLKIDGNIVRLSDLKSKFPKIYDECDTKSFKDCPAREQDVSVTQVVEGENVLRHIYLYFLCISVRLSLCSDRINFIRRVSNYAQDVPINELICHIETEKDNSRFFNMSSMWGFSNTFFKEGQHIYGASAINDAKEKLMEGIKDEEKDERRRYIGGLINFSSLRSMFIMEYDRDITSSKYNLTSESSSEEIFIAAMKIYDEDREDPKIDGVPFSMEPIIPDTMGNHNAGDQKKSEETFESVERKEAFNRTCQSVLSAVQREGIPGAGSRASQFQLILGEILENKSYINWKDRIQGELDRFFPARTTYRRLNMHHFVLGEIRPTTYGETLKMNIMVDTSASMFNPVNDAATEIENILLQFDDYEIDFYAVDTDICAHVLFDSSNRYSREEIVKHIKGSGGTDYSTFFKHLIDIDNQNPTLVITDMGFRIMEFTQSDIRFPVYWLAVDNTYDLYMRDIKNYVLPFGEVLPMKRL